MVNIILRIVAILLFVFFSYFASSQTITLDFPNDISSCGNSVLLNIEASNTSGVDMDSGVISIDLSGLDGVTYIGIDNQSDGPALTETTAGVPIFTFSMPLLDTESILFTIELASDCSTVNDLTPEIVGTFEFIQGGVMSGVDFTYNTFVVMSPEISISSSTPNNIDGVIGYEFEVISTVENQGSDTDSVYYCVADSDNADLTSIVVGGIILSVDANSPVGFSCFNIGGLVNSGSIDVTENWVIISCESPMNLQRLASYGCQGNLNCNMVDVTSFPETVLTLVEPVMPLEIEITSDQTELSLCGSPAMICVTIENTNGDDFVVRNAILGMAMIDGVFADFSTITMKEGDPVSPNMTMDSIYLGDIEDGEVISFSFELSVLCGVTEAAFGVESTVVFDELCEGGATSAIGALVGDITVQSAEFSIFDDLIQGNIRDANIFDAIIGVEDTIKVPFGNAGSGSVDEFTYYVINTPNVENRGIVINGIMIPGVLSNDTVYFTIDAAAIAAGASGTAPPLTAAGVGNGNGLLEENEALYICEIWEGIECELGMPESIKRQGFFGCGDEFSCVESNMSTTGVDFGFAAADLVYSEYKPLSDRPACYSDELTTLAVEIINEGNSIAKDITLRINQGSLPGSIVGSSFLISANSDMSSPIVGAVRDSVIASGSSTANNCVTGPGYLRTADAVFTDVNLMPGDTAYFTYQLEFGCDCRACNVSNIYRSTVQQISWVDPCEIELVNNDDVDFRPYNATLDGFFEGESSASGSGCITYQITSAFSHYFSNNTDLCYDASDFPDARFETEIVVGCGIDLTSATVINSAGTAEPSIIDDFQLVDGGNTGDDLVTFSIDQNFSGSIDICYVLDCTEKPAGCAQVASLRMDNFLVTDPTCASGCRPNVNCTDEFTFVLNCPPCDPCDGLTITDLEIERTNFCELDADNDGIADDGTIADATTAKAKRFVQGDTLRLSSIGVVSDGDTPGRTWEFAYLELNVQTQDFTIIGAEYSVYDASANTVLTCNSLSQFSLPSDSLIVTDLSIASMTALGCADFTGFEYADGDSLYVSLFFTSKNELFNQQSIQTTYQPSFYLTDDPYDDGMRYQCNIAIETMNQIGIGTRRRIDIGGRDFGGCDISPFQIEEDLYYGTLGFDEFCNEIRGPGIPQKFTFVKPSELEFSLDNFGFRLREFVGTDTDIVDVEDGGIP
ncbi:hypothetical protein N9B82_05855, partial [Saprospiraceae bacterium]|nr:hypothetical protein [Saprospiraceae bacterium]